MRKGKWKMHQTCISDTYRSQTILGYLVKYLFEFLKTGSLKLHQMASRISFSELLDRGQYIFILV